MSKKVIVQCDRCGKTVDEPVEIRLWYGFDPDPAGGSSTRATEDFEFCPKCATWAFAQASHEVDFEVAGRLAKAFGRKLP